MRRVAEAGWPDKVCRLSWAECGVEGWSVGLGKGEGDVGESGGLSSSSEAMRRKNLARQRWFGS